MRANAQRDGRPAEYRWRPLFNAAKCGCRPLLECLAVTLPRRETPLKLPRVPQTRQKISAANSPEFTILWGRMGKILLFNKFFSDCRYVPQFRKYGPTKLWNGAQMANFWRFLRSAFPASRVQRISDLHSKFALRPHHVWKYGRDPVCDR